MFANKLTKLKSIKTSGIIYLIIFLLYPAVLIIAFVYSLKFLTTNLNMTFEPIAQQSIDEKYTALDIKNYNILAKKIGLKQPINNAEQNNELASSTSSTTIPKK